MKLCTGHPDTSHTIDQLRSEKQGEGGQGKPTALKQAVKNSPHVITYLPGTSKGGCGSYL